MVHLTSGEERSEYQELRAHFKRLEREEIVRQREAILYLEHRVEALMRIQGHVQRAVQMLDEGELREGRRILLEVLEAWPSTHVS